MGNSVPLSCLEPFSLSVVGAVRLSYFNIFGMINKNTYYGLALVQQCHYPIFHIHNRKIFSYRLFSILIYVVLALLLILNLAPIRTYKFDEKWFYVLIAYTAIMSFIYASAPVTTVAILCDPVQQKLRLNIYWVPKQIIMKIICIQSNLRSARASGSVPYAK
jgi:phosphatidylserine synthase